MTSPAPTDSTLLHLIVPVFNEQENFPALVAEVEQLHLALPAVGGL
ncbi:MAG: hypothetical protein R3B90_22485 [Planctomycetaceae bacterium]